MLQYLSYLPIICLGIFVYYSCLDAVYPSAPLYAGYCYHGLAYKGAWWFDCWMDYHGDAFWCDVAAILNPVVAGYLLIRLLWKVGKLCGLI